MTHLRKKLPSANALFVFEAAARCGNFTRAAEELYVSQPAVSRMLSRMEEHLGVQLFERLRSGIALTADGEILYRKISQGFTGIEEAIDDIRARATGVETVTLSVSTAFTTHWLMPRMSRLNKAFPSVDLRFQLISGRLAGPVGDVDLGMRFLTQEEIGPNSALIMPETLLPVCSQTYLQQEEEQQRERPEGGHHDTLIVIDESQISGLRRFKAFTEPRLHAANMLRFEDYAIVVQAALLGQGITLGWLNILGEWLMKGALLPAAQELVVTSRRCCLITPEHRPQRAVVSAIRDWIIAETHADMLAVDRGYPDLRVKEALGAAGLFLA